MTHIAHPRLLEMGMKAGKQLAHILDTYAVELARRLKPDKADHHLYIGHLLELSYFYFFLIRQAATKILNDQASVQDFIEATEDSFLTTLNGLEDDVLQAPGFRDRYSATLDERLSDYGHTPAVGQYDEFGLYQFAFVPNAPSTAEAVAALRHRIQTTTQVPFDESLIPLVHSQIEEAMDALNLPAGIKNALSQG